MTDQVWTALVPSALAEEYEFLAFLKEGRQRQTLLLKSRATGRQVVLKCSLDGQEDLEEEYRLLRRLAGEGVPMGLGGFREGGCTYLLREYIPGESLLDYAQKRASLPTGEVREIGLCLCRTLKRLHSQNPSVIHRDIKLENIIRTPEGKYVLIDFGIARRYEAGARRDTQVLGTPTSAPPEQFGYRQTDPRSDVYALGVLLHELATGETRLDQGSLDPILKPVVERCTRFDPDDRYPDAAAVEKALLAAPARRWQRRLFRALAFLLLVVLGVFWLTRTISHMGDQPGQAGDLSDPSGAQSLSAAYTFASAAIEAEVCRQLGKAPGTVTEEDLERVEQLLLCGDRTADSWEQIDINGQNLLLDGVEVTAAGEVDTLEDVGRMKNLRTLALCDQRLQDLSGLEACDGLLRLAVHGNQIADLTPLAGCRQLQELYISDNPVSDLSPLSACAGLWSVNAGATLLTDLSSLSGITSLARLRLHDVEGLGDISALKELPGLYSLFIRPVSGGQLEVITSMPQLKELFLWHAEGLTDLTPLSGLTQLDCLFLHQNGLSSLEGAERLSGLANLTVLCGETLDLTPLAGLESLTYLDARGLETEEWTPLASIPALREVLCSPEQADAIRRDVGEPDFRLVS